MFKFKRKHMVISLVALLGIGTVASCTPHEVAVFKSLSPAQQKSVVSYINSKASGDKFRHVVSDAGLARLRQCESGGNYRIVSSSGAYRGAYQFHRTTWNSVAASHYPYLVGVDPAAAAPANQDKMARALWSMQGRHPWPHCGLKV